MPAEDNSTIGVEIELNLVDKAGFIVNKADDVLADSRNSGCFVAEATLAQVEYNAKPFSSIRQLRSEIVDKLSLLEEIAASHHALPVAASEFGAGRGITRTGKLRYDAYALIVGDKKNEEINTISGIHLHFSQQHGRELDQYRLLSAFDPISYAVTSTSPLRYDGVNSLNCHRIHLMRNGVFSEFPLHAKLQEYPATLDELYIQNDERFRQWLEKSGLPKETFSAVFSPENTGYTPIRKRDTIGSTGTFEVRTLDSCPLPYLLSTIAMYKGCMRQLLDEKIPLESSAQDGKYHFSRQKILLPTLNTLRQLEREATHYGMWSDDVLHYVKTVSDFAEQGLPIEEQGYLDPIREMIATRKNPASLVNQFLRSDGNDSKQFSPEQAAQGILFLRQAYIKGLQT